MITQEQLKLILNYDPETGEFNWLVKPRNRASIGGVAGHLRKNGYREISIKGKKYYAHRLAWLYMTGSWPKEHIDHINGNPSDNRFCNLREATRSQNMHNQGVCSNNTSGYKGVCWHKSNQKWEACI